MSALGPPIPVGSSWTPMISFRGQFEPEYFCGIHSRCPDFPLSLGYKVIWAGEVPEGARCIECGIPLADLEPARG